MTYKANVIRVVVSSPSDVKTERQLLEQIINDWNVERSYEKQAVLLPVLWETHAVPTMGVRAQESINKQIIENSDLMIAVFWTKLGSPTGVTVSGTIEEIENFLNAGKPVIIYFSSAPFPSGADLKEIQDTRDFKKYCMENGLFGEYSSIIELKDKIPKNLTFHVDKIITGLPQEKTTLLTENDFKVDSGLFKKINSILDEIKLVYALDIMYSRQLWEEPIIPMYELRKLSKLTENEFNSDKIQHAFENFIVYLNQVLDFLVAISLRISYQKDFISSSKQQKKIMSLSYTTQSSKVFLSWQTTAKGLISFLESKSNWFLNYEANKL